MVGAHGRWLSEVHVAYDQWSVKDRAQCTAMMCVRLSSYIFIYIF